MRNRSAFAMALIMTAVPAVGSAQSSTSGLADIGLRTVNVDGDTARFERYRDMGEGLAIERIRFDRSGERSFLSLRTEHTGRRDQRYAADYLQGGKVKVSFVWDQIRQNFSRDTQTLYAVPAPGVYRIDDAIQQALQATPADLSRIAGDGALVGIRSRRHIASIAVIYTAMRDLDLSFKLKSTGRNGTMPYGVTFGHSNAVELDAPIDSRTTDVTAGVEWANNRGSVRVAYDGSVFTNHAPTLIWDNPIQLQDVATRSSQGQAALAPNNTLHSVTATGSYKLPVRSRVTASVTLGSWQQDDALLPFTINSALASPALPRATAQAEARTVAMNYTASSRPWRMLWVNAKYRYYDFDNRTPHFEYDRRARYDSSIAVGVGGPETLSSSRHRFDVEAALTPMAFTSLRVGYGRENVERTHRIFAETTEDVFRTSADTTVAEIVTLRAIFEHSDRSGSGFDQQALLDVAEQPDMRHFDVADRERDRLTGLVQVAVLPTLSLSTSMARGKDDYAGSGFGLQDSETMSYSAGFDWAPDDRIAAGLSFVRDGYDTLQRSRSANPGVQFDDPTRDWTNDSRDRTRTVAATVDLIRLLPKTEVRIGYDLSRAKTTYEYGFTSNTTLPAVRQLTPIVSRLERATADFRYFLTTRVAVGALYWFDQYDVQDFSMGPDALSSTSATIGNNVFLRYALRPYRAHVASLRLLYAW